MFSRSHSSLTIILTNNDIDSFMIEFEGQLNQREAFSSFSKNTIVVEAPRGISLEHEKIATESLGSDLD